ncbi:FeoB-associated Cys-rich membrane protein [Feifania hominis]|uniref:FeoB-associated Cys-rich membrane protein n=1 Tax=Feifania hominis TaxID=2763660 RepID=A0A926DD33_9FIRM|nr:FeoB-associated Cys-rich membrane protein [Feifania hominis]MBC8535903.1 FeoB-associated Cys-rich membrane protein [Feifania hominis]
MNPPTIIVGLLVLAVVAAIVIGQIRKKRRGGGCGCGCSGCPSAGICHPKK